MDEFVEKLIERLGEAFHDVNPYVERVVVKIVNQLAEEYNGGWIPVSERLPVYLDNVLVCTENGGRTIAHLKHTPIEWRDMHATKIENVIAWMELPTPYQQK